MAFGVTFHHWIAGWLVLGAAMSGCRDRASSSADPDAGAPLLAPLTAESWLVALPVQGFADHRLAVPLGATSARPLWIALHGGNDRAEWACGSYRHVTRSRGFVLCPAGVPGAEHQRFGLGAAADTASELRAALPRVKARFREHLARGSVVLSALGPSVEHALELAREEPSFFATLVLVNGSTRTFRPPLVTHFAQGGGKRVLFVCSAGACDADVDLRAQSLRSAGVAARVVRPERGHGLDADVVARLAREWDWLTSEDRRWR